MCCLASCGPGAKVDADKFLITGQLRNVPDSTEILVLQEDGTRLLKTVMKDTNTCIAGGRNSVTENRYERYCDERGVYVQ